jgi:hypothetical protein
MNTRVWRFVAAAVLVAATASAQSLADVARREAARRKTITTPGKVYTNDSLHAEPAAASHAAAKPATDGAAPVQPPSGSDAAAPDQKPPDQKPADQKDAQKDEAYWRQRLSAERDGLDRAQTFADALQSRINALSTDFVNRDDPAQRAVIAADRQKAVAELERVKQEIQQHTRAIGDIQEQGRRAGVPAGWLR